MFVFLFSDKIFAWWSETSFTFSESWPNLGGRRIHPGQLNLLPQQCPSPATRDSLLTSTACTVSTYFFFKNRRFCSFISNSVCFCLWLLIFCFIFHLCSSWCAAAVSSGSISICLFSAVSLSCSFSQQPVGCELPAVSANCRPAAASRSCCCSSASAGQSGGRDTTQSYTYWHSHVNINNQKLSSNDQPLSFFCLI